MSAQLIPLYPGATAQDWAHLDQILGLTEDMLPVVSNLQAQIDPDSTIAARGKVPSIYNAQRRIVGLGGWVQRRTTGAQIERWSRERDYGICVQTRRVRAIDIDIEDRTLRNQVLAAVGQHLGIELPIRWRANSAKCLLVVEIPGEMSKRKMLTAGGAIEFLANGQQFVAVGTHPSGVRYQWSGATRDQPGDLPDEIPSINQEQFDQLWAALAQAFATEAPSESKASIKAAKASEAALNDPVGKYLLDAGWVLRAERDGRLHIRCPFEDQHTTDGGPSATTYWPAHTGGYAQGHFRCLHAHCDHRSDEDFQVGVGYARPMADEFLAIQSEAAESATNAVATVATADAAGAADPDPDGPQVIEPISDEVQPLQPVAKSRFAVYTYSDLLRLTKPTRWLIKHVLPHAQVGLVYGASQAGKSFWLLHMLHHLANGMDWRGHRVQQCRVVYVAAEGSGMVRVRMQALLLGMGQTEEDMGIKMIPAAPNMMQREDALELARQIVASGGADLIVLDTLAQSMPGGDENSGADVGKVLEHCKGLNVATGAMVLLVHHPGKDGERGARGWSGLHAALDVEIRLQTFESGLRVAEITKQKDGAIGEQFPFRLEEVVLGLDEDGDEITSCWAMPVDDSRPSAGRPRGKVGVPGGAVLAAVDDLVGLSDEIRWADEEAVINKAVSFLPLPSGGRDTRRQHVKRSFSQLAETGVLEVCTLGVRRAAQSDENEAE